MKGKHVIVTVLVTYVILSFVPSLLLTNFIGKKKGQ